MRNIVTTPRLLGQIRSSSNPNKFYDIKLGGDGVVYCMCQAWKMNKWCKHLDEWHGQQVQAIQPNAQNLHKKVKAILEEEKGGVVDEIVRNGILNGKW